MRSGRPLLADGEAGAPPPQYQLSDERTGLKTCSYDYGHAGASVVIVEAVRDTLRRERMVAS